MEIHLCDFCGNILHHKSYLIAMREIDYVADNKFKNRTTNYSEEEQFNQVIRYIQKETENTEVYDICPTCKALIDTIMQIRRKTVKLREDELNKLIRGEEVNESE